ncbi:MAG: dna integrity scanning protein disa, partial [Paenibacillaceae bacterium]|nr:dna integrity scanning protein disa [Paenibacillaceae bacterium]
KDYARDPSEERVKEIRLTLRRLGNDEILNHNDLARLLGYPYSNTSMEEQLSPRGYRVLSKIPRLPSVIIANLVERFEYLPFMVNASIEDLDEVDGIGEVRARAIKEGLKRIQDQVFIDRHI